MNKTSRAKYAKGTRVLVVRDTADGKLEVLEGSYLSRCGNDSHYVQCEGRQVFCTSSELTRTPR